MESGEAQEHWPECRSSGTTAMAPPFWLTHPITAESSPEIMVWVGETGLGSRTAGFFLQVL